MDAEFNIEIDGIELVMDVNFSTDGEFNQDITINSINGYQYIDLLLSEDETEDLKRRCAVHYERAATKRTID